MRLIDRGLQAILPEGDSAGAALAWMAGAVAAAVGLGLMVKGANGREVELSQVPVFRLSPSENDRLLRAWCGEMQIDGTSTRRRRDRLNPAERAVLADALLERGDPIGPAFALELEHAPYMTVETPYGNSLRYDCRNVLLDPEIACSQPLVRDLTTEELAWFRDLATAVLASGTLTAKEVAAVKVAVADAEGPSHHLREGDVEFYRSRTPSPGWGWWEWNAAHVTLPDNLPFFRVPG